MGGKGLGFVERMLTAVETCRQNQRNVLDDLARALAAHHQNTLSPPPARYL